MLEHSSQNMVVPSDVYNSVGDMITKSFTEKAFLLRGNYFYCFHFCINDKKVPSLKLVNFLKLCTSFQVNKIALARIFSKMLLIRFTVVDVNA